MHKSKDLYPVGFFDEFVVGLPGVSHGSLKPLINKHTPPTKKHIVNYLRSGVFLGTYGGVTFDVLQPSERRPIGVVLGIQTDGHWFWPSELSYYVEKYHIRLPVEFTDYIPLSGILQRQVSDEDMLRISMFIQSKRKQGRPAAGPDAT